jgi:hypothetical protein
VDAEHAPEERLVSPTLWPSLSLHAVASPGPRTARRKGLGYHVIIKGAG